MTFYIRPLPEALGAEVIGLDLSEPIDEGTFIALHRAHHEYLVLIFREQVLTPQQQIEFSRRFGPLDEHPSQGESHLAGFPDILVISTKRENGKDVGVRNAGPNWHSDLAYMERPAMGSMLYAVELPESGGDTGFANMYAAYENLPTHLKEAVKGKRAVFHSMRNDLDDSLHPVIRTHPETGCKSIFVNPQLTTGIEGMADSEATDLLAEIYEHNTRPEFLYFHRWQTGDLVFWDNRCVQHIADHRRIDDPTYIRHMHRTTIAGDVPF
ncbi:MAG TPA: taurine dioxygenase [Rhodospirillaceae bacterium]|nr:taurine dioxygenase [Rhodospirillaceae bacterium]